MGKLKLLFLLGHITSHLVVKSECGVAVVIVGKNLLLLGKTSDETDMLVADVRRPGD